MGQIARTARPPVITPNEVAALVADRLVEVERLFLRHLESPLAIVHEIGSFVAESGGKRVRPTLHLLCARLCRYDGPHDVVLATVLEFIHTATLVHDDIIDEARTRRGRPSVNHRWGNNVTVLFGDYLYAKAMDLAIEAGSLEIMSRLADVTLRMTEGEMLQTRFVGHLDLTSEQYFDLIERKTAILFGGCCEIAGILAGVDGTRREALRRYGISLGLAFQIVDDVLDLTGDPAKLGKPTASDLREGKATLPVIDLLGSGLPGAREVVEGVAETGREGPFPEDLKRMLVESGAVDRSMTRARRLAERASAELEIFPASAAREALRAVPGLLVDRDR